MTKPPHEPVLLKEVLQMFQGVTLNTFYEGTLGAGGHAAEILSAHPEISLYIGCDRDQNALKIAKERLKPWKDKVRFVHGNFQDLEEHLDAAALREVSGFFLTLGSRRCS